MDRRAPAGLKPESSSYEWLFGRRLDFTKPGEVLATVQRQMLISAVLLSVVVIVSFFFWRPVWGIGVVFAMQIIRSYFLARRARALLA